MVRRSPSSARTHAEQGWISNCCTGTEVALELCPAGMAELAEASVGGPRFAHPYSTRAKSVVAGERESGDATARLTRALRQAEPEQQRREQDGGELFQEEQRLELRGRRGT